jgi:hypothetical protein
MAALPQQGTTLILEQARGWEPWGEGLVPSIGQSRRR